MSATRTAAGLGEKPADTPTHGFGALAALSAGTVRIAGSVCHFATGFGQVAVPGPG